YRSSHGMHEIRALVTIGADGRFSKIRQLAGMQLIKTSPPMDVIWFRIARKADDPAGGLGRIGRGRILIMLDRDDYWQIGYVIPKGTYQQIHAAELASLRESISELMPIFSDRLAALQDWKQLSPLSVESGRLPYWYRAGLLLIGDAAHVMSPVGGVGINYAIQDAVAAANILTEPLQKGTVQVNDLAKVQQA